VGQSNQQCGVDPGRLTIVRGRMKELETDRLRLRFLRMDDADIIFRSWASSPRVAAYLSRKQHLDLGETRKMLHRWLAFYRFSNYWRYGIERKEDGALIGTVGIVAYRKGNPLVTYVLGEEYWGNGYMTESLRAFTRELFENGCRSVQAEVMEDNIGSNRVLQKCGFRLINSHRAPISAEKTEIVTFNIYRLKNSRR